MASISRANIRLVGSHFGVSLGADGSSQMSLPDVAFFHSFCRVDDGYGRPACILVQPAGAVAAYRLTEMMARHEGMCYMRTHRPDVPILYDESTVFQIGGCQQFRDGTDLTLVSAGFMLTVALRAADELAATGSVRVEGMTCSRILKSAARPTTCSSSSASPSPTSSPKPRALADDPADALRDPRRVYQPHPPKRGCGKGTGAERGHSTFLLTTGR
jgi:transketolase